MSLYTTKGAVTITCNKRLTPFLEQEVKDLGFTVEETFVTGVRLRATLNECIRLNLCLRCASQVLYSLEQFEARDADEIYRRLHGFPWESILPQDGYFSITSNVPPDPINNAMFANLRVKDAVELGSASCRARV